MPDEPGSEPISDDELLYRRIPVSKKWYAADDGLSPEAFDPTKYDITGISLTRAKYSSIEEAARGLGKQGYYVAVCCVRQLRANGVTCVPRPEPDNPGHCEIPDIRIDNREADETLERKLCLAELFKDEVHGPFLGPHT